MKINPLLCSVWFALIFIPNAVQAQSSIFSLGDAVNAAIKTHWDVQAQRANFRAMEATRGTLFERFAPGVTAGYTYANATTIATIPTLSGYSQAGGFVTQVNEGLSPSGLFAWKAADQAANSQREQVLVTENQVALKTIEAYGAVVMAREQLRVLKDEFLRIANKMQSCVEVASKSDLMANVAALLSLIRANVIAQESAKEIAEAQFLDLTGSPAGENLLSIDSFSAALPLFPVHETALRLAQESSPIIRANQYAQAAQKVALQSVFWNLFSLSTGYGPTYSWSRSSSGSVWESTPTFTAGVSVNLGILSWKNARQTAKANYQAAAYNEEGAEKTVRLQVETDFIQYNRQLQTICMLDPSAKAVFKQFDEISSAIDQGTEYRPEIAISTTSQALSILGQLYGAYLTALGSLADLHAQMGDLNQPTLWQTVGENKLDCTKSKQLNFLNNN